MVQNPRHPVNALIMSFQSFRATIIFCLKIFPSPGEVLPQILISLWWFKWSPASVQSNDTMATWLPPAGAKDWRHYEKHTSLLGCCPDTGCWTEEHSVMTFALLKQRQENLVLCWLISTDLISTESSEFPVYMTEYAPLAFSEHLLGIRCWKPARVCLNHNYFLMI